jgi:tetratricopeptide (TPR) repeat protein
MPTQTGSASTPLAAAPALDPWIGRGVGPYQVLGTLGAGAMATVYWARHTESGEMAALKTVLGPRESLLPRIRREIQALARIRHPGIVRILDSGTQDGVPWYAMELIEGVTLREHVPPLQSRLSEPELAERLSLVRRLCAALAYLHGEGLIHRDLKPGNVLVRPGGRPVLVDFGLVSGGPGLAGREALDIEVSAAGTPMYMAPEQIRGELLDARADLYALGCILYELLTGRPPFRGRTRLHILQAHLTQAALPPSSLVPELSRELDALVLRLLAKRPAERMGYADDVAAALASLGARAAPDEAAPRARAYLYRPGFAGRREALSAIEEALEALRRGQGGLLLIGGESGIGKTRLAMEAARQAEGTQIRVLTGECLPGQEAGGGPLHPLRRTLQAVADRCRERGPQEMERLLGRRARVLGLYEPALLALPGLEAAPEPAELPAEAAVLRLYRALAETFAALAEEPSATDPKSAPVLLILDDLQWADDLTLGLLDFLLRTGSLQRAPLLVVGAYRLEETGKGLRGVLGSAAARRIELGRLDAEAVGSIVGDMLALVPPPPLFTAFLSERSGGNPFFVAEYLRTAVAEGLLYREEAGRWMVAERREGSSAQELYEALPLPRSVHDLVARRLDGLSEPARRVLEVAAVLGRDPDETLLEAAARQAGLLDLDALEELQARQVLEAYEGPALRFLHDQIWEVALGRIELPRRLQLHRAAAEALERRPERDESLAMLGRHWQEAGEPARARHCYLAGARRARDRYAHGEAQRLYRAYLALVTRPDAESVGARNELALELAFQGRPLEALPEHEAALAEARALRDPAAEARTLQALGDLQSTLGRMETARGHYERALELARGGGDRQGEGSSLNRLASLYFQDGSLEVAHTLVEQALDLHREVGDRRGEAAGLNRLSTIEMHRGRLEQARVLLEQALALHRELGDRRAEGVNLANLGVLHSHEGLWGPAQRHFEEALAIFREIGHRRFEAHALVNLGDFQAGSGRPQQALALFEQGLAILEEIGDRQWIAQNLAVQAVLKRRLGALEESEHMARQAEATLREIGDVLRVASCLCEEGHIALAQGRLEEARSRLDEAGSLAARMRAPQNGLLGRDVDLLRLAIEAYEAGQPVFRGDRIEDLPEGLRRWLRETGQLL